MPFGSRDKVLQVSTVAYELEENNRLKDKVAQFRTLQEFRRNEVEYSSKTQRYLLQQTTRQHYQFNKRYFPNKIQRLLNSIKIIKQNKQQGQFLVKQIKKCNPQILFKNSQNTHLVKINHEQCFQKKERKSPKFQKNRLMLQSLDVVPCKDSFYNSKIPKCCQKTKNIYYSNQKSHHQQYYPNQESEYKRKYYQDLQHIIKLIQISLDAL